MDLNIGKGVMMVIRRALAAVSDFLKNIHGSRSKFSTKKWIQVSDIPPYTLFVFLAPIMCLVLVY